MVIFRIARPPLYQSPETICTSDLAQTHMFPQFKLFPVGVLLQQTRTRARSRPGRLTAAPPKVRSGPGDGSGRLVSRRCGNRTPIGDNAFEAKYLSQTGFPLENTREKNLCTTSHTSIASMIQPHKPAYQNHPAQPSLLVLSESLLVLSIRRT